MLAVQRDRREADRYPDAITPRARGGIIADENSGAITNSGVMRASTRMKPARSFAARVVDELSHQPASVGIDVYRAVV